MKDGVMIYFSNEQEKYPISYGLKRLIRRAVVETLAYEGFGNPCQVSVTFVDNEGIRVLNRDYRGIDRETDVLSFPLFEEGIGGKKMLGDIVLSLEKCEAQAAEFGHSFKRECAFLTVHSTLHLLGYDHETGEEDETDMRRRQSAVVQAMGLGVK